MLRIVGVCRSREQRDEFVLLQNQGGLKVCLRGHALVADSAIASGSLADSAYVFTDDEHIPAGLYVLLSTGAGFAQWARTKDGAHVYRAYVGKSRALWADCSGPIHLLCPQHTFAERGEALLLR